MPLTDISGIKCKLFGVSFLNDEENARVRKHWNARFSAHTAFFVRGNDERQISSIAQELCAEIQKQGIYTVGGENVILAFFLDFTNPLHEDRIREMASLPGLLTHALACQMAVTLQFGFVGKLAFSDAAVQRENTQLVVAQNIDAERHGNRRQLCLVASPTLALDGGYNWKAVALFLDLMRRQSDPAALIPGTDDGKTNNDVGFLSYAEHSASQRTKLENELRHLTELLGDQGGNELRQAVAEKLVEIERSIRSKYHIDAAAFPQHPAMVVENAFLRNNRAKAAKGEYAPYNEARNVLSSALSETARGIEAELKDYAAELQKSAADDLAEMIDQKAVGIELLEQKRVTLGYLDAPIDQISQAMIPKLQYTEAGCVAEIAKYLEDSLSHAIMLCKKSYLEALKKAYEVMADKGFSVQRDEYTCQAEQIKQRLTGMCSAEEFYSRAITGNPLVYADFHPYLPNGKRTLSVVVRGAEMLGIAKGMEGNYTATKCFSVNEKACGTPSLDDAPMKVLGIMFKDCDNENLLDLIPEVTL